MASSNLQWAAPKPLKLDGNVSENFRKFEEHWTLFEKTELKGRSEEERCSYFHLCVGERGREVYKTLTFATPETETNAEGEITWLRTTSELKSAFKTYCNPRKNITYERHKFNIRNQEDNESIDQYVTVLRTLAATCEFEALHDGLIRDRIVCGIRNQNIKERLLRESDLTLPKAVDICRASEVSREQMKSLNDQNSANVDTLGNDQLKHGYKGKFHNQKSKNNKPENGRSPKKCGNCGRIHEPKSCPAYGKKCNNCQKLGHFAKYCRSQTKNNKKSIHDVDYESDSSAHGIDMVKTAVTSDSDEEHAYLKINNKTIRVKLDSGAETNVLSKKDYETIIPKRQRFSKLKLSTAKLTAFGGHNIPVIGKCYLKCQYKGTTQVLEFQVVENGKSLLGCANCKSMKLVTFHNVDQLRSKQNDGATHVSSLTGLSREQIFEKYSKCFDGLGRISDPYHIKIKPNATPVVHPPRKIPSALRERVHNELTDMESKGIIKKVNEPTAWVNSMVVNEKRSGKLRICIDPRDLNKALLREHYQLPTQQEITSRLTNAKFFSKLDANSGFWQMPLDEESSYLTTFNTPFGRYRFTVIPFGVVFAQEVFHKTVHEKFQHLPGCETDIDDILIWGRTLEEHDRNLERVLNRVADVNMTLSKDKCQFRQTEITYLGETLTAYGVKPDESKVEAIKNYPKPENKQDVQRLLGMVNFIAKFAPNVSDVTAPLRELIKKNIEFHWHETHEKAFQDLQHLLTHPNTLRYYDVAKPVILQVDASQNGLGAALIQDQGPVAYASKAMNDTQRRYAQIEKELLAVVFACKRFHQYV
ncbi:uncharacterized protein K02A2.6-like [Xenia sp. Carnegie-2017]|uniref:uncharacterized protein K02A2.6-like n=1 Tax=Xenia sp. Carnegie-2017 TaxID=2897299 RepID=UPI001F0412A3|nr:uncharacterized protein K02A2.6-like [Xenia sp. Carnegie-2017]